MEEGPEPFTEGSVGLHVLSVGDVKQDQRLSSWPEDDNKYAVVVAVNPALDKDFLCPICIQTMKDAFLTACGHSFCYKCIMTHLSNKNNCPCCGLYLTNSQIFPNFLLSKERRPLPSLSVTHLQLSIYGSPFSRVRIYPLKT